MKFEELINVRQSVRKYQDRPVEREKINRCLEAARLAPSASNGQPWKFVLVDEKELVGKIAKETYGPAMSFNRFVDGVPVILVIVIEPMKTITQIGAQIKDKQYSLIDIGIAADHFCLQAVEEGLGTCMLGWYNEKPIKKILGIPKNRRIGLLITLGYPPEDYRVREKIRKGKEEIIRFNSYK